MSNRVRRRGGRDVPRSPLAALRGWVTVDDTSRVGAINAYRCDACGELTVTIDIDPGVTPMFLACRASGDIGQCKGRGVSLGYRVPAGLTPVWEWYRPTIAQARRKGAETYHHAAAGGLLLRAVAS